MTRARRRSSARQVFRCVVAAVSIGMAWSGAAHGQGNPVPLINQPLIPDTVAPGGPAFTLTVNGSGFVKGASVKWNGAALVTTFVTGTQLEAAVPASEIAVAGSAVVTVLNPGSRTASNAVGFEIMLPYAGVSFGQSPYPLTGIGGPVVTADFNGDGKLDLAAVVELFTGETDVAVLLGNGDGTFGAVQLYPNGGGVQGLQTGDFNGDGIPDLVSLAPQNGSTPSNVAVLLGNGNGTFKSPIVFNLDQDSSALAVGDFNGDGRLDVVVSQFFANRLEVLLGNGDGSFRAHQAFGGRHPSGIVVGDFNRDGKLDMAVANDTVHPSSVSILLGNGDGSFQPPISLSGGFFTGTLLTADFNGDGILDLAGFGDTGPNGPVDVFLGKGNGYFDRPIHSSTEIFTENEVVGDFNGDGIPDLAVNGYDDDPNAREVVSMLFGKGDGSFESPRLVGTGVYNLQQMTAGDFNRDGRLDLALSTAGDYETMFVLLSSPLIFNPTSVIWNQQQVVGQPSAPVNTTLTNTSDQPIDLSSIAFGGPNPQDFTEVNACPGSIPAGGSCDITLTFTPGAIATQSGILEVTDSGIAGTENVILTGVGTYVELAPPGLNFGKVPVGFTSPPEDMTLTNTSSATLQIYEMILNGQGYQQTDNCGSSLPPQGSCTIEVTFTPTHIGTERAGLILIDSGGPQENVDLIGFGEAP
jgi:FG-GAP-like repeat/Transmembrane protein 131-like N-terminal